MAVFRRNRSDIRSTSIRSTTGVQGRTVFFRDSSGLSRTGIGRELFSRFCIYMERENIQHFYVFTDTSCNYGFYENMNMFRRGTKRVKLKVNHRLEEFSFFLYENREH